MKYGTKVRVLFGRNAGEVGKVTISSETGTEYYVDFNRNIIVNEGFGSTSEYPDGYWVPQKYIEIC